MVLRAHLGDRRAGLRFQVNGELWASIDVQVDAELRNLSATGAMLEATINPEWRPIRAASLTLPDGGPDLLVQVRHITPIADAPSGDRCFLGVEFIGVNSSDRRAIGALLQAKK